LIHSNSVSTQLIRSIICLWRASPHMQTRDSTQ